MKRNYTSLVPVYTLLVSFSALAETPSRFAADRPVDCLHIKLELNVNQPDKLVQGRQAA